MANAQRALNSLSLSRDTGASLRKLSLTAQAGVTKKIAAIAAAMPVLVRRRSFFPDATYYHMS
jgi:hypothetical protein